MSNVLIAIHGDRIQSVAENSSAKASVALPDSRPRAFTRTVAFNIWLAADQSNAQQLRKPSAAVAESLHRNPQFSEQRQMQVRKRRIV
jgi:hypothetical protein